MSDSSKNSSQFDVFIMLNHPLKNEDEPKIEQEPIEVEENLKQESQD